MNINDLILESFNPKSIFRIRNVQNKIRSPELAFRTVYGIPPIMKFRGTSNSQYQYWNGLHVDVNLKEEWLSELASIPNIQIISSCAGHDADRIAYVVFKPNNQKEEYIKNVVQKLKSFKNTYASYDNGNKGSYRICVATPNWFKSKNNELIENWWDNLADNIKRSI